MQHVSCGPPSFSLPPPARPLPLPPSHPPTPYRTSIIKGEEGATALVQQTGPLHPHMGILIHHQPVDTIFQPTIADTSGRGPRDRYTPPFSPAAVFNR